MKCNSLGVITMISSVAFSMTAHAQEAAPIKYEALTNYYITHKPGIEQEKDFLTNVGKYTNCDEYKNAKNEFAQRRLKEKEQEHFDAFKGKSHDLPKRISLTMSSRIGKYNFDKQAFAFKPFDAGTYVPVKPENRVHSSCTIYANYWPEQYELRFTNGEVFNGIPVDEAHAEKVSGQGMRGKSSLKITAEIVGMDMDNEVSMRPQPIVKARIVQMDVYPGYAKRTPASVLKNAPLIGSFKEADIAKLEAAHKAEMQDKPLDFSPEVFAAWADKLGADGLVAKHKLDTSRIVALNPIRIVDVKDIDDRVNRETAPDDGKQALEIKPRVYNKHPDIYSYTSPLGTITMKIGNWADYVGKHDIKPEDVAFLKKQGAVVNDTMSFLVKPTSYELVDANGGKEHVLHVELEEIQIEHKDPVTYEFKRLIRLKR